MTELAPAPDSPFAEEGSIQWGTYRGSCQTTDLSGASEHFAGETGGFFREKRWQWFCAANARVACGGTLFDAGYATTVFLWVFDRVSERMIADETEILPPFAVDVRDNPGDGGGATLRGLSSRFDFERRSDGASVEVSVNSIRLELEYETGALDPVTAICPIGGDDGPGMNVTQKESCLPVRGRISTEGRTFELGPEGLGMLDYTHGLLERETNWRWVIAGGHLEDGAPIGFNFSQNFNDDRENVVWLGDDIQSTARVHIEFDGTAPAEPWSVRSEDGAIDLSMIVEGVREHEQNFQLVSSSYVQPIGRFHGRVVDREVHDLFGVAETHRAKW